MRSQENQWHNSTPSVQTGSEWRLFWSNRSLPNRLCRNTHHLHGSLRLSDGRQRVAPASDAILTGSLDYSLTLNKEYLQTLLATLFFMLLKCVLSSVSKQVSLHALGCSNRKPLTVFTSWSNMVRFVFSNDHSGGRVIHNSERAEAGG